LCIQVCPTGREAKIALLESALEIKKAEFDTKINIELPEQMQSFLREEENMLKAIVEKIVASAPTSLCARKA